GTSDKEPDAATCMSSPLVRANVLHQGGEGVNHPDAVEIMANLTPADQLALISGGPNCPNYDCDFDGTGDSAKGVPDFKMRDGPRGVHTHNGDKATSFAVAMARAASFDLALEYE